MSNSSVGLGQWPNAPLALVVAQVRFEISTNTNPDPLGDRIGRLKDIGLPNTTPLQQMLVGLGGTTGIPSGLGMFGKDLRSSDGTRCLRLQQGVMTFNSSSYRNFEHFSNEWGAMLGALCTDGDVHVQRLGLRYVDFIIPEVGDVPESYLDSGFGRSPSILGDQAPMIVNVYEYTRDHGGGIRIQYNRGFGPPELPRDIGDTVTPPTFLIKKYDSGSSAVLDIDRWRLAREQMSAQQLIKEFVVLHEDTRRTFHKITNQIAHLRWQTNA